LLKAGADVNEIVSDGSSALALAIMNGQYDLAVALLDAGANPNASAQGWAPLHQLIYTSRPNYSRGIPNVLPKGRTDSYELAKALLEHGADPNARQTREPSSSIGMMRNVLNRIGATPYLLAAKAADAKMMRALASGGADPKLATNQGATPLMAAAG